ncbi:MAG: hypothetical protein JWQ11_4723 [Rhizobacter sp.]|nr:hypothetical protein [Rhizobacter sp.]
MKRDTAGDSSELALAEAYRAIANGDSHTARGLAQSLLLAAKSHADALLEGQALSCLAHCDRMTWRLRRASDTSRRAAQVFQRLGQSESEAVALNTLAHCCMLLGRSDEAVEAALLGVRLCEVDVSAFQTVIAHNCLGMAYGWSNNFAKAKTSLEMAVFLAARSSPILSSYEPTLNLMWVEVLRLTDERYRLGSMQSFDALDSLVRECRRLERAHKNVPLLEDGHATGKTMSVAMKAMYAAWTGQVGHAKVQAERAIGSLGGTVTWLDSLVRWASAEIAWAQRDWAATEFALLEMKTLALSVEHEQMACLAHLMLAQVYELQDKTDLATLEHRALRTRERRMANESLVGREAIVNWQIDARRSEQQLAQALEASSQFERWSFEDALTGIANRRSFERALAERIAAAADARRTLAVAMIDVDQFKAVNDTYTHLVGDQVLKAVAEVLTRSVRENDLAARLAGDEFVILFGDADRDTAVEISNRIKRSVAEFDWNAIAPTLRVSISVGVSTAVEGDTAESLLQRSDKSMYSAKPGWVPTDVSELA